MSSSRTTTLILLLIACCRLATLLVPAGTGASALLRRRRALQERADSTKDTLSSCEIPSVVEKSIPASFTASYPGSGAKLTWKLIEAITGLYTSDDHEYNGRVEAGFAVAVKTHFPSHTPPEVFHTETLGRIKQAALLVRNPLSALPSYHNYLYEQKNGLRNHSTRAPVDVWIAWRDENFHEELAKWTNHIRWWMEGFFPKYLHLLPYEHLVSPETGPVTLQKLGEFLGSVHPDIQQSLVAPTKYSCIWEMFVQGRVPGEEEELKSHRTGGPTGDYPYNPAQLELMIQELSRLSDEYHDSFPALSQLLQSYIGSIAKVRSDAKVLSS